MQGSDYHWKNDRELLIWAAGAQGDQLYVLSDDHQPDQLVDTAFFRADGHCSHSPDRQWILYDSYPDREQHRSLYLYHIAQRRGITLGRYLSPPVCVTDIRCDLHPRWDRSGTRITLDSTHEGYRGMYLMDVSALVR